MSLTQKQLHDKRRRKSDRRANLAARRDYLLHRYGSLVGDTVYRFERLSRNSKPGKKPSDLIQAMKLADSRANSDKELPKPVLASKTTGEIHRETRKNRKELQARIASQGHPL